MKRYGLHKSKGRSTLRPKLLRGSILSSSSSSGESLRFIMVGMEGPKTSASNRPTCRRPFLSQGGKYKGLICIQTKYFSSKWDHTRINSSSFKMASYTPTRIIITPESKQLGSFAYCRVFL